nr:hypothetical protein [Tanacetum cinerariifolium]
MLHIFLRVHDQSFDEQPFEEEIIAFIHFLRHSAAIRDDHMFSTIKLVSRHQNTQQFGALLPIELTNEEIRNSNTYKEYYEIATGDAPPKPKASARRTRNDDGEEGDGDDANLEVERDDDKDDEEEGGDDAQEYYEEEFNEETKDEESFDPILKTPKNSKDKGNGDEDLGLNVGGEEGHVEEEEEDELYRDSSSVSSQFVTSMLNPTLDVGMKLIFKTASQMDVSTPTSMALLPMTAPTMTPSTIATISTTSQAPILPTTFARAVSVIPGIIQQYMDQWMNEAVKVAIQIQSDNLRDEAQRENDEFLKTVDKNIQKIIKEHVKE